LDVDVCPVIQHATSRLSQSACAIARPVMCVHRRAQDPAPQRTHTRCVRRPRRPISHRPLGPATCPKGRQGMTVVAVNVFGRGCCLRMFRACVACCPRRLGRPSVVLDYSKGTTVRHMLVRVRLILGTVAHHHGIDLCLVPLHRPVLGAIVHAKTAATAVVSRARPWALPSAVVSVICGEKVAGRWSIV